MINRRDFFLRGSLAAMSAANVSNAEEQVLGDELVKKPFPVVMAPRHDGCEIIWVLESDGKPRKGYIDHW